MSKSYSEKLKDPRWQKKRLETLDVADWTCQDCGTTTDHLHVHHFYYLKGKEPWEVEECQLGVLCEHCHDLAEWARLNFLQCMARLPPGYFPKFVSLFAALFDIDCPISPGGFVCHVINLLSDQKKLRKTLKKGGY